MSKNFNLRELVTSDVANKYGINNTPTFDICCNLESLIDNVLQPVRDLWKNPITINSGYRCPSLNRKVGGVSNSHHMQGYAADITTGSTDNNKKLFELIRTSNIPFTQLIDESHYSWVHISYIYNNIKRQVLHL